MESGAPSVTFKQVLKNRQFLALWLAQFISSLGDWLAVLALFSLVAFRRHGTPHEVAGIFVSFALPWALLGPVAGVFVDRWNVKWTMISSDLVRAVLAVGLAFASHLWETYALFAALSAVSCFFLPAQTAAIPQLVSKKELLVANSVNAQTIQFNRIISPALAGLLVAWAGEKLCFYLDGLSFVISATLLSRLVIATAASKASRSVRSVFFDLKEGLLFLWNHAAIRFVTGAMGMAIFAVGAFDALIVVFVRDILHSQSQVFGGLITVVGIGIILGAVIIGKFAQKKSRVLLVVCGISGLGIGIFLLAISHDAPTAILCSLSLGFAVSFVMVPSQTLVQEESPQAILGRVSSTSLSLMTLAQIVGVSIAGKMADWMGIRNLYLLLAVLLFLIGSFGFLLSRSLQSADAHSVRNGFDLPSE